MSATCFTKEAISFLGLEKEKKRILLNMANFNFKLDMWQLRNIGDKV